MNSDRFSDIWLLQFALFFLLMISMHVRFVKGVKRLGLPERKVFVHRVAHTLAQWAFSGVYAFGSMAMFFVYTAGRPPLLHLLVAGASILAWLLGGLVGFEYWHRKVVLGKEGGNRWQQR